MTEPPTRAERITDSALGHRLRDAGLSTTADLAAIAEGWRAWGRAPGASRMVPHGELPARVPG